MTGKNLKITFVLILFGVFTSYAQQPKLSKLQGLGQTKYHKIDYTPLKQTYHIFIRLPEQYEESKKYPTIYLLDGGITYPLLASYYRYLRLANELPDCIIVGISYGTTDWKKGNNRARDFTAKSKERDFWGGADNFSTFFKKELFPLVEKNYSSNPKRRIIFGQSLGGQYALFAAQKKTNLFWGHIASNPALHRNLDFFLKAKPKKSKNGELVKVFVSSGSDDNPRFRKPAVKWIEVWNKRKKSPWLLKTVTLKNHNHFSAATEAFRQGTKWIFDEK